MRRSPLRSPPRMRGKVVVHGCVVLDVGITPACAGKSLKTVDVYTSVGDHPRVCGEKPALKFAASPALGSPPRVRGKVSLIGVTDTAPGITPACAGKRRCTAASVVWSWDHPRVCGEKFFVDEVLPGDTGSPPRVRGKECGNVEKCVETGITPACAGKSSHTS